MAAMKMEKLKDDADASKGFVISFDDDTPKKPKPQLKQRRLSNKKNSVVSEMSSDGSNSSRKENVPPEVMICIVSSGNDVIIEQTSLLLKYILIPYNLGYNKDFYFFSNSKRDRKFQRNKVVVNCHGPQRMLIWMQTNYGHFVQLKEY